LKWVLILPQEIKQMNKSFLSNTSSASTWIWYPGDYEIWLGNQMNNRRTERGAFFPHFWKMDSHYVLVEFSKKIDLAAAEEIETAAEGTCNIKGGIIVVDFIDMQQAENRHKVYERMKDAMAADRTKHNILPLSKFCLLQITRQRVRPEEHDETAEVCPTCNGTGKVAPTILVVDELESKIKYIFQELNKNKVTIKTHPYLAAFLTKGMWSLKNKWAFKFFKSIKIEEMPSYSLTEYHFFDGNQEEIVF